MNSVRIVADSGCDLPISLAVQYGITIVPVLVRFGQEYLFDNGLTTDEFWARAGSSPALPATSSPPPASFHEAFKRLVDAGHDVVCLTLPSRYSGTFNAAWLAAQEFGQRVRVVDSGSFSLGMGLQVLAAAKEALAGQSAEFIQAMAENLRTRTSIIFVLDTLEWVRHGGRLDRLMPLIERMASTFKIKPVIEMNNGEFRLLGVARSTHGALSRIEQEVRGRLPVDAVAAAYTRSRDAAAGLVDSLAVHLKLTSEQIMLREAGPAFAAHAGPNALGAAFIRS